MKVSNIKDIQKFFDVVDSCAGKVELVTGEGDRLNLKSKLSQYVSLETSSPTVRFRSLRLLHMRKKTLISLCTS